MDHYVTTSRKRFPASVFAHGNEPDPRFSLANERTFLAWTRTALALIAAGVALEGLSLQMQADLRLVAALILVATGVTAAVQAWFGWTQAERAMRLSEPLPASMWKTPLALLVALAGLIVTAGLLL